MIGGYRLIDGAPQMDCMNDVWCTELRPTCTPFVTSTPTATPTATPSRTYTATASPIASLAFTRTATRTITPTPNLDTTAPAFQVIAVYDPDATDIIKIRVIASELLIGNALDKVVVVPQSSSHPDADITASATYEGNNTWILEYPRAQGYGDIKAIYVTGTDLASNQGTSDGTFEKEVQPLDKD